MVDSTAAYERDSGAASYVPISGTRPVGDRGPRAGNLQPDDLYGAGPEHASALLNLASASVMSGKLDDALQLAVRAVAISERGPAENEPDVAILINDLARLCLKESAHAVAEPLLLRLLEMKRSKGEDHPEVGTVLASLATVRHALGRHESAEQLWRRVLEIRERTLAPNHFSLAIALEHLGEACAARGKIVEALQHFERAQTIRELTLGAGHPSLRIARDRIADLQLQAGESLDAGHEAAVPVQTPEKYRLLAVNNPVEKHSMVASPQARERSTATRKGTAKVIEPELKEEIASPPPAPTVMNMAATGAQTAKAESVPYRDLIMSMQQEMEDDADVHATAPARGGIVATLMAEVKERQKATVIVVGVVATLAILATASRAWTEQEPPAIGGEASLASVGSTSALTTSAPSARSGVAGIDPANPPAIAAAAATPVTASKIRLADQRPAAKKPTDSRSEQQQPRIAIPKMSSALTAGFDSVVRARSASSGTESDPLVQLASAVTTPQRMTFDRDDAVNQAQRAQLIGSLPVPRYPAQLVDVQGEVRVRFDVDVTGRPVMSTVSVLSSPNTILTAAVLKVIPSIRFVPARSGGSDSKAVADVVQLGFQFRPTK